MSNKEKYLSDPEYREQVLARRRQRYRDNQDYRKKPKPYLVMTSTGDQISSHFTRLGAEAMAKRCNLQQMEVHVDRQLVPDVKTVKCRHKGVDMAKVNAFLERKGT